MDRESPDAPAQVADLLPTGREVRGSVVDVVKALRADNDWDAVLKLVAKLVADNNDMSRRLARIAARFKNSEKVGKAQLVLFLDALQRGEEEDEADGDDVPDEADGADRKLRDASGIDDEGNLSKLKTGRRHASRRRERRLRLICVESATRSPCRRSNVPAHAAVASARASTTRSPR